MRFFKDAHYDFLAQRKRAYILSAVLLGVGLVSLFLHTGLRQGVEFTGGTLFQVQFAQPTSVAEVRDAIGAEGLQGAQIQQFGDSNDYPDPGRDVPRIGEDRVPRACRQPSTPRTEPERGIARTEAVGPKVGTELRRRPCSRSLCRSR